MAVVNAKVDRELKRELKGIAKQEHRSLSETIGLLLRIGVEKYEPSTLTTMIRDTRKAASK